MYSQVLKYICVLVVVVEDVKCYPIVKSNVDSKIDKDEKRYPNGTIVGKYCYTDNEGNPIQVKYYADDASYGVELKSIKVMSGTSDNPLMPGDKLPSVEPMLQNMEMSADFYNPSNIKYKTIEPFEILNKESNKNHPYKTSYKSSPDYEIYFQNELKTPKKCGKDKVRVYLDKEKRKIREATQTYEDAAKFCNQL